MDRLFWPDPLFMAVPGPEEPWVINLRGRVEEALEAAIVPIRVSNTVHNSRECLLLCYAMIKVEVESLLLWGSWGVGWGVDTLAVSRSNALRKPI